MCGIAGFVGKADPNLLVKMIDEIRPRGPDGDGTFSNESVHLGHTRLSIIDLEGGAQPMTREDVGVTVSYNGEIYNYDELRGAIEAQGYDFRTTCDTELIPLGYRVYGRDLFAKLNGIFAIAIYDHRSGELILARDHFGVKPLYFAKTRKRFLFSSSARSILHAKEVKRDLNETALRDFLQFRYSLRGEHFYSGIETLQPAHMLTYSGDEVDIRQYWEPFPRTMTSEMSEDEWAESLQELLDDSHRLQLRSDVPVGFFLSGGIDSSGVAHFARKHHHKPMKAFTFSVGDDVDEVDAASDLTKAYKIDHEIVHTLKEGEDAFADYPKIVASMDVPVGDAIILPLYLLSQAAAKELKVVLTGEGADEMFGGYVHFPVLQKLNKFSSKFGSLSFLGPLINFAPINFLNRYFDYQASLGELGRQKLARIGSNLNHTGHIYRIVTSAIDDFDIVNACNLAAPDAPDPNMDISLANVMHQTFQTWLPNQILNKTDQLSMAHGLEARVPYLDPRIFELLNAAPDHLFIKGTQNKVALRSVLAKHVQSKRPKVAFHMPMETKYQEALTKLCLEWLNEGIVKKWGILKPDFVSQNLAYLRKNEFVASKRLMSFLSLHAWLEENS